MYMWVNFKYLQFNGDFTSFFTGFFQNLLSKVISINNIYNDVVAQQQAGNTLVIYYDLARLVRLLMDFSPVETETYVFDDEDFA